MINCLPILSYFFLQSLFIQVTVCDCLKPAGFRDLREIPLVQGYTNTKLIAKKNCLCFHVSF